jgi:hypothetical protein
MATTNRIPQTVLALGGRALATLTPGLETLALQLTVVQIVASSARLVVKDTLGKVVGSAVVAGTGIQEILIDRIATQTLAVSVECLLGSCRVQVDEITGVPAASGAATVPAGDFGAASIATAKLAAGAVTPAKMGTFTALKCLSAAGRNNVGAIVLAGTIVTDRLVAAFGMATIGGALLPIVNDASVFEATVTVAGQIQQTSVANLTGNTYVFLLAPAAA